MCTPGGKGGDLHIRGGRSLFSQSGGKVFPFLANNFSYTKSLTLLVLNISQFYLEIGVITPRGGKEGASGPITVATGSSTLGNSGAILLQTGNALGKSVKSYDPSTGQTNGKTILCIVIVPNSFLLLTNSCFSIFFKRWRN